jgi:polyisoprenoid-binding protein YceI
MLLAAAALAACSPTERTASAPPVTMAEPAKPAPVTAPGGVYKIDPAHTSLTFRVSHIGLSNFTARFNKVAAELNLDTVNPAKSSVTATIDPRSLETFVREPANFNDEISGKGWLEAGQFPTITFKSTKVETTGPDTARVTGDFTLHGVTKPIVLDVKFNGGYPAGGMDPSGARVGFSATGSFNRADFGIAQGVPAKGSTMGVSDAVQVIIETEFTQAAPKAAAAAPAG